jgi:hypothetical protein
MCSESKILRKCREPGDGGRPCITGEGEPFYRGQTIKTLIEELLEEWNPMANAIKPVPSFVDKNRGDSSG